MSAHRYWRLRWYGSVNQGFRNGATEIELRTAVGGADQTGSGTASADSSFSGSPADAFDNSTATNFQMNSFNDGWIKYDFGSGQDKAIVEVTLRENDLDQGPSNLVIQASDDDSTWIDYHYALGLSWANNETKTFTFGPREPWPYTTAVNPTSVALAATYLHPASAQRSVQWQLEEATGDWSTPLADTGEVTSGSLTTHTFTGLTAQTVYRVRCRMREDDNGTWGEYSYLWFRTPQWAGSSRENFDESDRGSTPTGWSGTSAHTVETDQLFGAVNSHPLWSSSVSKGAFVTTGNNATWTPGAYPLQWTNGPSIANVRVTAVVQLVYQTGELVIGARYTGSGHWYALKLSTGGNTLNKSGGTIASGGGSISVGTVYYVMLECDGNTIRGKWWAANTTEPSSWNYEVTDSSFPNAGKAWIDGDEIGSAARPVWRHLQIEYTESQVPITPTVVVDAVSESAADFSSSTFSGGSGVHKDTQWQVARDAAFTDLVEDVVSTVDKTSHSINGLDSGQTFYVRCRYRDSVDAVGGWATGVSFATGSNPGVGDPPEVSVGSITATTLAASVDADSLYLSVTFRLQQGTTTVASITKTGAGRFEHTFELLTNSTTYQVSARVVRQEGTSPWAAGVEATTLATDPDPGDLLGCPPALVNYSWNPDGNPVNWQTRRGYGFYVPYAGQPLRGVVECNLRHYGSGGSWDIEISDDLGASYSALVSGVTESGEDGDGLQTYKFLLDTTLFADGQDYRLKATAGSTVVESLSFCIDNVAAMEEWTNRQFSFESDRYAHLWWTKKGGGVWGGEAKGSKVWYQASVERSLLNYRGAPLGAFVDTQVPLALGGDVTVRFYLYDGEGGLFHQQARLDFEGWMAGIGFFVTGSSDAQLSGSDQTAGFSPPDGSVGLFVGLSNLHSTALGCCDDFIVSFGGTDLVAIGRPTAADLWDGQLREDDNLANSGLIKTLERVHGKHSYVPFKYLPAATKALFADRYQFWRDGHLPGVQTKSAQTCGRRYEMVVLRARVEVDAGDHSRLRIRVRVDHAGVEPPSSGYWHYDKWHNSPNNWVQGSLAIVGAQHARTLYGAANGSRTFVGWSMLPLSPTVPPTLPTEPLEPIVPETASEPCALILQAYEDDRVNLKWEVGTDPGHPNPYLMRPEHYGEQEVDIVKGAASIGTVDVMVVDRAQVAGDQDSGWMTERLSEGGTGVIRGRRFRLLRYIDATIGWVVIADGPGGTARMDSSYAAYTWSIRDTRETERTVRAFDKPYDLSLFPQGLITAPWGAIPNTDPQEYMVEQVTAPITGYVDGTLFTNSRVFGVTSGGGTLLTQSHIDAAELIITEPGGGIRFGLYGEIETDYGVFHHLLVKWRYVGETDLDWRYVTPAWAGTPPSGVFFGVGFGQGIGDPINRIQFYFPDDTPPEDVPAIGGPDVEYYVFYTGPTSEQFPYHLDDITAGAFLKNLYDGLYSPRDSLTGLVIPTGIRYDAAALAAMTEPIRARFTEPWDNIREQAESLVYAPLGYAPTLDFDLAISPKTQVPPDDFTVLPVANDDNTEPTPDWNGGERVVNVITFEYPRWYVETVAAGESPQAIDGLVKRAVILEFRDEDSIIKHNEQLVDYDGQLFAALGDVDGAAFVGVQEVGRQVAGNRELYVMERYRDGAQLVRIPVKRVDCATWEPGDFRVVDLSWIPDYVLRRRAGVYGGQILSIKDLDCAWRVMEIEEVLPVVIS